MTPPPEDPRSYWEGRVEARLEGIAETLRVHEIAQLRRHDENKLHLSAVDQDIKDLRAEVSDIQRWQSYVKGVAITWASVVALLITLGAEIIRRFWGKP